MITASLTDNEYFKELTTLAADDGVLVYDTSEAEAVLAKQNAMAFGAVGVKATFHLLDGTDYQLFKGFNIIYEGNIAVVPFQMTSLQPENCGVIIKNRRADSITISGVHTGDGTIVAGGQAWFVWHESVLYRLAG